MIKYPFILDYIIPEEKKQRNFRRNIVEKSSMVYNDGGSKEMAVEPSGKTGGYR